MSRSLAPVVALVIAALLALGPGPEVARAAEGDFSKVPRAKLTQKPFRGIALITIGSRVVCTGFVIAPRKVLTAAHCLVQNASAGRYRFKKGLPERIRVYRGFSQAQGGSYYRACGVARVWAHSKFVKQGTGDQQYGSRAHDYAVLTMKCAYPRNAMLRLWATEAGDGNLNAGQRVRTAGYPADNRFVSIGMNGLTLWRTEGRIRPVGFDDRHLPFTGFVAAGMSGAPLWRTYREDSPCGRTHCVVAIVTECAINRNGECRLGNGTDRISVRITPQVKQLVKRK